MPGGDLPLKNDEYINDALDKSPIEDENEENIFEAESMTESTNDETADTNKSAPEISEAQISNNDEIALSDGQPSLFAEEYDADSIEEPLNVDQKSEADNNGSKIEDDEASGEDDETEEIEGKTSDDESSTEDENAASPDTESKGEPTVKPRMVDNLFDFIELFVFTLAAVFIITSFFFRYSIVDGGSMQNTLHDDEALILRSFLYTPRCNDVVVVQDKSTALKDPIVKRVIAVGGQTVKFTRDAVYVDGVELDEPYVYTADYKNPFGGEDIYRYSVYPSDALLPIVTGREDGVFYEITVPEGEIFVMGDHRNNSRDSREIGTLHEDAVIGKVVLRFLPFSEFGKIE